MKWLFGVVLVVIGVLVGASVGPALLNGDSTADALCSNRLDGSGWEANLSASTDLASGTRLVCERNGTQQSLTVDVSINLSTGESNDTA